MSFNQTQQFTALIDQAKHILITFKKDGKGDAIASAAALSSFLIKQDKQIDVVCDDLVLPKKFNFLKHVKKIQPQPPHLQQFMITVDVEESGVQELSYDVKDGKLQIYITPKTGFLTHTILEPHNLHLSMILLLCWTPQILNLLVTSIKSM